MSPFRKFIFHKTVINFVCCEAHLICIYACKILVFILCSSVSFFPCILCLGFIFSESKTTVYFAKAQALTISATIVHHHFFLMIIYFFCLHVFFCCCCQQILFQIIFLFRPYFIPVRVVCLNVTRLSVIVII